MYGNMAPPPMRLPDSEAYFRGFFTGILCGLLMMAIFLGLAGGCGPRQSQDAALHAPPITSENISREANQVLADLNSFTEAAIQRQEGSR